MNFKELGADLGLDEDEYRELIDLFIESGATDFQALQTAMAACDADQVMQRAHTIKGASGNLGLVEVSEVAKTIEENASQNQLDGLDQVVATLKTQFDAIQAFVSG